MVTRTLSGSLWRLSVGLLVVGLVSTAVRAQDPSDAEKKYAEEEKQYGQLRIKVKDADNKDTGVYEKVVIASPKATLASAPGRDPKRVAEWSVFFRIKDDQGSDKPIQGWVRVGSSSGKPLGWVKEEYLKVWRTRFLLEIQDPDGKSAFSVKTTEGVLKLDGKIPKGYTRLALVTQTPKNDDGDNTDYPVTVYTGKMVDKMGGGSGALAELKMEVIFVIESTDFMMRKYGDRPLFDYLKDIMTGCVEELQQTKELQGAVRLGLAEYRDNVPKAEYPFRLSSKLTDDPKVFVSAVKSLKAVTMNDDWEDDVISGLNLAIGKDAGWTENSVKHVILIGAASCQLKKKGEEEPGWKQLGGLENSLTKKIDLPRGHNASGLTIEQLCARAASAGGADDVKIRLARTIHTVQLGRPEEYTPELLQQWPELPAAMKKHAEVATKIQNMSDDEIEKKAQDLVTEYGEEKGKFLLVMLLRKRLSDHQEKLAEEQYKLIAKKNNDNPGLNRRVEPSVGGVKTASLELAIALRDSFKALKKLREGGSLEGGAKSELIQPLWKLEKAEGGKVTDLKPATDGIAKVRGEGDKQVALRRVMVTEIELRRLKATLEALNKRFAGMAAPAARKNVADVLKELKTALALTSVGQQEFDATTDIQALITDLPLRTGALKVSARSLSLMSQDAFTSWLSRLEAAQKRIGDLLDAQDKFSFTSQEAVNDKIAYLELAALP